MDIGNRYNTREMYVFEKIVAKKSTFLTQYLGEYNFSMLSALFLS